VRLLADGSLTFFVARELRDMVGLSTLVRAMVVGAALTAAAGLFFVATQFDAYGVITGTGDYIVHTGRARGLSYEPRGLGLACAYASVMVLLSPYRGRVKAGLLALLVAGLAVTYSATAIALFATGMLALLLLRGGRQRIRVIGVLVATGLTVMVGVAVFPNTVQPAVDSLTYRLDPSQRLAGVQPNNLAESIAYHMDVFDSSAFLFLISNPQYIVSGTGPGLVGLPATDYVPLGDYSGVLDSGVGINSMPQTGPLYEVANGGLVGLALWLLAVIVGAVRLRRRSRDGPEWRLAYSLFLVTSVLYVVQYSGSPLFPVLLGLAWAVELGSNDRVRAIQGATTSGFVRGLPGIVESSSERFHSRVGATFTGSSTRTAPIAPSEEQLFQS